MQRGGDGVGQSHEARWSIVMMVAQFKSRLEESEGKRKG